MISRMLVEKLCEPLDSIMIIGRWQRQTTVAYHFMYFVFNLYVFFPHFFRISSEKNRDSIGCSVHNLTLLPVNDGLLTSFAPQCKHRQDENTNTRMTNVYRMYVRAQPAYMRSQREGEESKRRQERKKERDRCNKKIVIAWDKSRHNCRFDDVYACNTRLLHNTRGKISQPTDSHTTFRWCDWEMTRLCMCVDNIPSNNNNNWTHRNEYSSTPNRDWFLSLRQLNAHQKRNLLAFTNRSVGMNEQLYS